MENSKGPSVCCYEEGAARGYLRKVLLRTEGGQALLELALVVPIFFILLIGATEFARLAYAFIEVASAARAGIQYGAQNHTTASDMNGMMQAASNDGSNITNLRATATNFCICSDGTAVTCANAPTTCTARIIEYVQVATSAVVDPLFHCPGLPKTFTLRGQATMRVGQ